MSRKDEILRAAIDIAEREGVGEMSVRSVAARAGVGASTLRYYFPTQQSLKDAVLAEIMHRQLSDFRITDRQVPPRIRLHECLKQFLPPSATDVPQLEAWLSMYAAQFDAAQQADARSMPVAFAASARRATLGWLQLLEDESRLRVPASEELAAVLLATTNGLALDLIAESDDPEAAFARADRALMAAVSLVVDDE